jgi:hypothetical protein
MSSGWGYVMASSAWETISNNRRREPRYRVRLTASISIVEDIEEKQWASVFAYTRDISREGLCLLIPSSRVGHHNLEEDNHTFSIMLVLPTVGSIKLESRLVYCTRYAAESEAGYLAGVRITKISSVDYATYEDFINSLS